MNEAVERAHRAGALQAASLMVAAPAAADAVRRSRAMPDLRVGLHLVLIEGPAVLPPDEIPDLVAEDGWFPAHQLRLGVNYFARPRVRRQLAAEIRAQFAAFAATGLVLHHADAHKHMHLHPTVGRLMLEIGREFGLNRVRVPAEPPAVLARCGAPVGPGAYALYHWTRVLRRQVRAAGMATTDHCFGIAWSGHMTIGACTTTDAGTARRRERDLLSSGSRSRRDLAPPHARIRARGGVGGAAVSVASLRGSPAAAVPRCW